VNPQLMAAVLADDLAGAEGAGEEEGGAA
jgi:hypothetical protein